MGYFSYSKNFFHYKCVANHINHYSTNLIIDMIDGLDDVYKNKLFGHISQLKNDSQVDQHHSSILFRDRRGSISLFFFFSHAQNYPCI